MEKLENLMHSNGTTAIETFGVILPSFFLAFISSVVTYKCPKTALISRIAFEFVLIVVPIVLIVTISSHNLIDILISLFVVSISLCAILKKTYHPQSIPKKRYSKTKSDFITVSRSTINLISVIGILAVDFMIFPRRFAKTIDYGYSLMDVGVGLFVYSNGIVSPETRDHNNSIIKSIKSATPLLVIGGFRFMITKEIDYQVPVSEYGVHWNFFITLATIKIFSSLVLSVISIKNAIFSGISLLLVHEVILQLGVKNFVLGHMERDTFLKANREGIVSSTGYVGLYFLSVTFGRFLNVRSCQTVRPTWSTFLKLCLISGFLLWASLVLGKNFGVSRRLANSGYCIWIMFLGISMTSLFYLSELIQDYVCDSRCVSVPIIFEAINYNGLTFFLLANVLTGLINVVFDTLSVNTFWSFVIINVYMIINCITVCILFVKNMKIKL